MKALYTLLLVAACMNESAPSSAPTTCLGGGCVEDPRPHCVRSQCKTDADCRGGQVCFDSEIGLCARSISSCVADTRAFRPSVLIDGFDARAMDLTVDEETLRLTWTSPPDTEFVTCALFTCEPVILPRPQKSESDRDPIDGTLKFQQIANAQACVLELATADNSRQSLRMAGALTTNLGPTCEAQSTAPSMVSMLAAACWAYDTYDLVAASELVPIHPKALPSAGLPQEVDCAQEPAGTLCYEARTRMFGACSDGVCSPRCTSPRDCERWAQRTMPGSAPEVCEWTCEPIDGNPAGVCARAAGVASLAP